MMYEIVKVYSGIFGRVETEYKVYENEHEADEYCRKVSMECENIAGCFYTKLKGYIKGGIQTK